MASPWRWLRLASTAAVAAWALFALARVPALARIGFERAAEAFWPAAARGSGEPALDLKLPDLDGVERSLSEFRAKIVVINVWRTW